MVEDLGDQGPFYALFFFIFILVATTLLMNMLIGALVETVSAVAEVERETHQVTSVREQLDHLLDGSDVSISKAEFAEIVQDPAAAKALQSVGVDALGLIESVDAAFKKEEKLDFTKILELLLDLRGGNPTKVKDLVSMRSHLNAAIQRLESRLDMLSVHVSHISQRAGRTLLS